MTCTDVRSAARRILDVALICTLLGAFSLAMAQSYSASIVEMRDSSITVPLSHKTTAEVLSARSTIMYRGADLGKSDAQAVLMTFLGDVMVRDAVDVAFQADWLSFDPATRSFEAVEIHVPAAGLSSEIHLHCSGGQLFINGEGSGTYPTQQNPRDDLIPDASVYCNGNRVGVTFRVSYQEP